ncbi:nuclear transport factor 2 family protein [Pseudodonghicola flavimaris]|uniref:Nuclear transport factor 2 family protein n=1 Tax=Pseudodonghicola flavimaris TaxID=3050036 RepID=A0ABT7F590_9RHOB|nr:nuclear transport factor 2 family protein [Pseudodonghicola flavimaris]MDK3019780.1 nuclear transport factor 2 family protein [Pseudodonghicola flavimaris]
MTTPVKSDEEQLKDLIQEYFDAIYEGDIARVRQVFHPLCRLFAVIEGKITAFDHDPYMERVAGRPSGASRGDARDDQIVTLSLASPTTASARVKDIYAPHRFVNELTFMKEDGRWWVIVKAWHVLS